MSNKLFSLSYKKHKTNINCPSVKAFQIVAALCAVSSLHFKRHRLCASCRDLRHKHKILCYSTDPPITTPMTEERGPHATKQKKSVERKSQVQPHGWMALRHALHLDLVPVRGIICTLWPEITKPHTLKQIHTYIRTYTKAPNDMETFAK